MNNSGYPEALLVDLDGTLIDSSAAQRRAWSLWAKGHGLDWEPFVESLGLTHFTKISILSPQLDAAKEATVIAALEEQDTEDIAAMPGAADLWAKTGFKLAVVTSATRSLAVTRLNAAGLDPDRPDLIIAAEDVSNGKPSPECYLAAAGRLGCHPSNCLAIEDAPAGAVAAVAAGVPVVAITSNDTVEMQRIGACATEPSLDRFLSSYFWNSIWDHKDSI